MSETWFFADTIQNKIRPIEIERSTDKNVWIEGHRCPRNTKWRSYFPTWEEAHAHLLQRAETNLVRVRRLLQRAQSTHGNIKGMKPPTAKSSA